MRRPNLIEVQKGPVVFGTGNQTRDFVYLDDIIECMLRAADTSYQDVVNVGSGDSQSFLQVLSMISTSLDKKVVPMFVPEPKSYFVHTLADTPRLASVLNVRPISLQDGITKYLDESAQN
jgi:UDP-glucose 4-epimerase